jgi:hypothetical protein
VNRPKLHHHVPQHYQGGFSRDGPVWVFDRVTNVYRHDTPRNIGAITHDYSVTLADGTRDPKVEEFLARIEDLAKPILAKLRNGTDISDEEKETFAYYVGFFFVRGPRFQRMLDEISTTMVKALARFGMPDVSSVQRDINENPELTAEQRSSMNAAAMFAFAKSEQYTVSFDREHGVKMMVEQGIEMQNYFRQMDWTVLHATEAGDFVTTDNPVVVVPAPRPSGAQTLLARDGVITVGAVKIFPLAFDACLLMLDRGSGVIHREASSDLVIATNAEVAHRCERLVLARDERELREVVEIAQLEASKLNPIFAAQPRPG